MKILMKFQKIKLKYFSIRQFSSGINYDELKVVFFGTDSFSCPSLKVLHNNLLEGGKIKTLDVVTSFKALNNPVRLFSKDANLKCFDFKEFSSKNTEQLNYDLGLVVSFGHLIPEKIINSFPLGILNVHASLLPKLRGAAPIVHAIRHGNTKTGVTIMKIRPKHFDIGEILLQKEIDIGEDDLMPRVHDNLAQIGANLLLDVVLTLPESLKNSTQQNEDEATYAPKINEEFTRVRWNTMSAKEVYDLYRSLYSFKYPFTFWNCKEIVRLKEVKIGDSVVEKYQSPGQVRYSHRRKCLTVVCCDSREVEITCLGIGKKSKITAQDFRNGFLTKVIENKRKFS